MSAKIIIVGLFLTGLLFTCGSDEQNPSIESEIGQDADLLGTWETVEYEVNYETFEGGDTAFVETIREAEWGRKYGVNPPSTVFTPDGKFQRTNRLRTGQVTNVTNGVWKLEGDSLFVIEPNVTYTYLHELQGDRMILTGLIDQDQDGERDDRYRAVYRLVGRTRN